MARLPVPRLNDSGEDGVTCIVGGGALHSSRHKATSRHAHPVWKIHVGVDAPVWVQWPGGYIGADAGVYAVLVPPHVPHRTGAIGWSIAYFATPGSRGVAARGGCPCALEHASSSSLVAISRQLLASNPCTTASDILDEVAHRAMPRGPRLEARVGRALMQIARTPGASLHILAGALGLSLDRLSHLVSEQTGLSLRAHALWWRLLSVLHTPQPPSLAAAALLAGFSDQAHMTRTHRRFLGRTPAEFRSPPEVLAPWWQIPR